MSPQPLSETGMLSGSPCQSEVTPDELEWHEAELLRLPYLRPGVTSHYEGSIDKTGGNADWDWWLYQDGRGEWVLFDVDGPGCVHNFVQHRYPSSEVPVFRFYFDGEPEPRYTLTPADFGTKPPFVKPLADVFVGDDIPPRGRGPIWVVRSFLPMPFEKGCRVTSSVKLEGNMKEKGGGGWGHFIYHRYTDVPPRPAPPSRVPAETARCVATIAPGADQTVFEHRGAASISDWRLRVSPPAIRNLWVRLRWDDEEQPAAFSPLGAFFGNEIGNHPVGFMTHGQAGDGTYYCRFPMPFWKSARVEICNRSDCESIAVENEIQTGPVYPEDACGYFRASDYYPITPVTPGRDSVIGSGTGSGHIVAATLTGLTMDKQWVSCEGDVRLHLDGNRTPQIESDGSESHACYGWGFCYPPQQNPFSGYDGSGDPLYEFSETRVHVGDVIPFLSGFRFGLEAGDCNNTAMRHSGLVLYYGRDEAGTVLTDTMEIGDANSETVHQYRVEGVIWRGELASCYEDDISTPLTDHGVAHNGSSEFIVAIRPDNDGVRLRRRSDQKEGRQRARVFVDGMPVTERTWYFADRNPHRRWLEDEFEIPASYTRLKDRIHVRLEHLPDDNAPAWTEFFYQVFSHATRPPWPIDNPKAEKI